MKLPSSLGFSRSILLATLLATPTVPALATPFTPDLSISGSLSLNSLSIEPTTGATRSGTLSLISGGAASQTTLQGTTVNGSLPLSGPLTDLGDGLQLNLETQGSGVEALSALTIDGLIALSNTSPDRILDVLFNVGFELEVEATGDDAFSSATLNIQDSLSRTLLPESIVSADSIFGPGFDAVGPSTDSFSVSLNPGQSLEIMTFLDVFGTNDFSGSDLGTDTDQYRAAASLDLRIEAVMPQSVPLPATLPLITLGLGLLIPIRRKQ
ncbi:MAG: hypothetical protein R3310_01890 [Candidatus Competibacteraceae bacterium]|nr:hypothetical protein [Candidatus Competibacteraceae bacterium]